MVQNTDMERYANTVALHRGHETKFLGIEKTVEPVHKSAETDFRIAKEHQSKLKFNFIEHQTKYLFLKGIQQNEIDCNKENNADVKADLENKIKLQKQDIKCCKQVNKVLKAEIEECAKELNDCYDNSLATVAKLEEYYHVAINLEKKIEECQKHVPSTLEIREKGFTLETASDILEEQIQEMILLKDKQQYYEAEIKKLEAKLEQEEISKQELIEQTQAFSKKLENAKASDGVEYVEKLGDMNEWYEKMLAFNQSTSGDTIQIQNDGVIINCTCDNSFTNERKNYQICVQLHQDTRKIKNVLLIPSITDVQPIIARAIENDDVAFLVREIKREVQKYSVLAAEVEILKDGYNLEWNGSDVLSLQLDSGECCKLLLEDAPPGQQYSVTLLSSTALLQPEQKIELQKKLKGESLEQCLDAIIEFF